MVCTTRQLTQAQREAGYDQQRTGVIRSVRPFSGTPTVENLIDFINRELMPAFRQMRDAANAIYRQVADNAPSANPLYYYFSTNTANADPTDGRIRLNQATQDTATVIRVSQNNARLLDVTPWLDVMAGGPTTPLGVVTLYDSVNPSRFLRFDLNTMTDQGLYWDLGVTIVESSHDNPFVEDEPVVVSFIGGVSAAGSTVPVGSLSPIATDTFVGNISGSTVAPSAVPLANIDSTSIIYDGTSHTFQRAALTGAVAATQNSNATLFAGIRDNGSSENDRTNLNFLNTTSVSLTVTDDSGNDELEITATRAALTGFAEASSGSNATTSAEPIVTYSASTNMSAERVTTSSTSITVSTAVASQIEFQRAALTGEVTASANANATTVVRSTDFQTTPWTGDHQFNANVRLNETLEVRQRVDLTLSADADDVDMSAANVLRIVGNGFNLTGMAPFLGASANGQTVQIFNADSGDPLIITHEDTGSSAANRFVTPGLVPFALAPRSGVWARYDDSADRWFLLSPGASRLIKRHSKTTSDSSITITPDAQTTWFRAIAVGAGGGGGGADSDDNDEACAGSGGGAGAYFDIAIAIVSGNITGAIGAGGTAGSSTGGTGGTGGDTTLTYNGTTYTAGGAAGGDGMTIGAADTQNAFEVSEGGQGGTVGSLPTGSIGGDGGDGSHGLAYGPFELAATKAAIGGTGGSSFFGGGGKGGIVRATIASANGEPGRAPGSGGGGGARIAESATTGATGGTGEPGCMMVEEWAGPVPTQATIS